MCRFAVSVCIELRNSLKVTSECHLSVSLRLTAHFPPASSLVEGTLTSPLGVACSALLLSQCLPGWLSVPLFMGGFPASPCVPPFTKTSHSLLLFKHQNHAILGLLCLLCQLSQRPFLLGPWLPLTPCVLRTCSIWRYSSNICDLPLPQVFRLWPST